MSTDEVGDPAVGGAGAGDQPDQGVGLEVVERRRRRLAAAARAAATAASKAAAMRASVSGSSSRWVWHIPVTRSTQRRTQRCCLNRSSREMPSSRDRMPAEVAHLPLRTPPPASTCAERDDGRLQIVRARPGRRHRAGRRGGRWRRHARPTPPRPPTRHARRAARRTPRPAGPPPRRRDRSGAHRRPTASPPAHTTRPRRAGRRARRCGRRRRPARPAPAATSRRARRARPDHTSAGSAAVNSVTNATTSTSNMRPVYEHMFDCQGEVPVGLTSCRAVSSLIAIRASGNWENRPASNRHRCRRLGLRRCQTA